MNSTNNKIEKKWGRVQSRLRAELGEEVFASWFGRVEPEGLDSGVIMLSVPTRFLQKWLQSHYSEQLLDCCSAEINGVTGLEFRVRSPHDLMMKKAAERQVKSLEDPNRAEVKTRFYKNKRIGEGVNTGYEGVEGSPLDPRFTFESFVVGAPNRLAYAAAQQITESIQENGPRYNPLFIHADVGLGKTHLLQAIAWEVKRRYPEAKLLYLTVERFMYRFAEALRSRDALAFKDKLRGIDLLLIDDMEFLQGRASQDEFGHTLNTLIDSRKQIVIASDRAPNQLDKLDARMRSRLAGGLVTQMTALDYDTRLKILQKRMREETVRDKGFIVPDSVLEFLANRLTESGRELEGAITRLRAAWQLTGQQITLDAAEHTVRDLMNGAEPKRIRIDDILKAVSKHYGVNRQDLLSKRRTRSIVRPRQIGMFLSKQLTTRSLPEIGRRFGGRDHTTVIHAVRVVQKLISDDPNLREEVELLKRLLRD